MQISKKLDGIKGEMQILDLLSVYFTLALARKVK